ncbi:MAG: hypothetical protein IJM93_01890 [Oscillospiraceae bacterium]|nr:hypothetical protein [Oscillospiraceae bacterium]
MKKRILSLVLALVMLASMMSVAFAYSAENIKVKDAVYDVNGDLTGLTVEFYWNQEAITADDQGLSVVVMTRKLTEADSTSYNDYTNEGYFGHKYDNIAQAVADTTENLGILGYTELKHVEHHSDNAWEVTFTNPIDMSTAGTYYVVLWNRVQHWYGCPFNCNSRTTIFPDAPMAELKVEGENLSYKSDGSNGFTDVSTSTTSPSNPPSSSTPAADYQFDYAYDCQRSPTYPNKNGEVTLRWFDEPYTEKDGLGTSASEGDWTLTYLGTWAQVDGTAADNGDVEETVGSVASEYEINVNDVEIYELKNGGVHVAYGPMLAYGLLENSRAVTNDVKDCALFIGDTRDGGDTGFFLTDESMDGVSRFNFIAENTPNDNIVDPNAPQQPEQTTQDTPTVNPPASRPNYDTSEEIVWQSGAKEESKANPATGDGFNTAVSAVMALSVLAGAAVVLGKKK